MDTFKAVTWNVFHGSKPNALEPHLIKQVKKKVSIFLMQEAGSKDLDPMIESHGLKTFNHGQWRVAWDPEVWPHLIRKRGVRLSDHGYYSNTLKRNTYSECAEVLLSDEKGRSLTALCYHTPAHIQIVAKEQEKVANRFEAAMESFITIGELARDSETTGFLAGGDDNWDEDTGVQEPSLKVHRYLLGRATGLRQIQAGKPTFGKREIDDFRIPEKGRLVPVGKPWVVEGGGQEKPAHKIHGREFGWKR